MRNTDRIQVVYETQDGRTSVMGGPGAHAAEMRKRVVQQLDNMGHRVRYRHDIRDRWMYVCGTTVEHFEKL